MAQLIARILAMCNHLEQCSVVHLASKSEGAQRLAHRCRLWVDVDEHECLAIATQARLHKQTICQLLVAEPTLLR